ncbi:hypothetical protein N5J01_21620, partial [Stenotrophomonas sp. GD03701]|nr:hypothetical protein [Stenotrophomonas sp. GD03701]
MYVYFVPIIPVVCVAGLSGSRATRVGAICGVSPEQGKAVVSASSEIPSSKSLSVMLLSRIRPFALSLAIAATVAACGGQPQAPEQGPGDVTVVTLK